MTSVRSQCVLPCGSGGGGVEFTLRVIALPGRMIQSRRAAPPAVMLVSFGASHSSRARAAFYDTILYSITLWPYASCRSNGQACSRSARVNREGPRFRLGFPPRDSSVGNGRPSQGPASSPPVLLVKKNSTSTEHMIDLRAEWDQHRRRVQSFLRSHR